MTAMVFESIEQDVTLLTVLAFFLESYYFLAILRILLLQFDYFLEQQQVLLLGADDILIQFSDFVGIAVEFLPDMLEVHFRGEEDILRERLRDCLGDGAGGFVIAAVDGQALRDVGVQVVLGGHEVDQPLEMDQRIFEEEEGGGVAVAEDVAVALLGAVGDLSVKRSLVGVDLQLRLQPSVGVVSFEVDGGSGRYGVEVVADLPKGRQRLADLRHQEFLLVGEMVHLILRLFIKYMQRVNLQEYFLKSKPSEVVQRWTSKGCCIRPTASRMSSISCSETHGRRCLHCRRWRQSIRYCIGPS